jgi:ribosomal 50S subunit-recycling heat shock protein
MLLCAPVARRLQSVHAKLVKASRDLNANVVLELRLTNAMIIVAVTAAAATAAAVTKSERQVT